MLGDQTSIKVAILGAGKNGARLLELLSQVRGIQIAGIADEQPDSPGLRRALDLGIPVTNRIEHLLGDQGINLIIDVTGNPAVEATVARHKPASAEILSGIAVRFLWQLVQHESRLQAEVSHADKLAAIGSFAAGIAHDINNPLYLILGLAEDLLEQPQPEVVKEHAHDIIQAVKRTSRICADLTRYARRAPEDQWSGVDLHAKLDEALKIARYALLFEDMTVVRNYEAMHRIVRGNPDDMLHMFVNLITNAIQAMDGNGTLTLTTRNLNGTVEVAIADTGSGIPADAREKIFDPFYTTKEPGKGTGLGLYNVKTILQKLEGTIAVESEMGKGTTFQVRLPRVG